MILRIICHNKLNNIASITPKVLGKFPPQKLGGDGQVAIPLYMLQL